MEGFGMNLEIVQYLMPYKDDLHRHYTWPFDVNIPKNKFGFDFHGKSIFTNTQLLKSQLQSSAIKARSDDDLKLLAEYFIREWGGVSGFDASSLVGKYKKISFSKEMPINFDFDFKNISSWSKWLCIICPAWAVIYDARVAYSINAINYLTGSKYKIFPMPESRNAKINFLDISTLILNSRLASTDSADPQLAKDYHFFDEKTVYCQYVELVKKVGSQLYGKKSVGQMDVEMLLFSLADRQIFEDVFHKVKNGRKK
jgi:hypothetical protein